MNLKNNKSTLHRSRKTSKNELCFFFYTEKFLSYLRSFIRPIMFNQIENGCEKKARYGNQTVFLSHVCPTSDPSFTPTCDTHCAYQDNRNYDTS